MENQRLLLGTALLFIVFLLWQNWLEFQAKKYPPVAPVVTQTVPAPAGTVGTAPSLVATPGHDVPVTGQTLQPEPSVLGRGTRIHVVTDQFDAEIDTLGGDLRRAGLRTYPESIEHTDQPFQLLKETQADLFIAQSGLVAVEGKAPDHHAVFAAEQQEYRLADGQAELVVPLTWSDGAGLTVTKTYTFRRGSFLIDVRHDVHNGTGNPWRGGQYRQFQRIPPAQASGYFSSGVITYTGTVISTPAQRYEKIDFSDITKEPLNQSVQGGWVAMIQHYFLGAWVPMPGETNDFYTRALGNNRYALGLRGTVQTVSPNSAGAFQSRLYVGPKRAADLEKIAPNLELTVDYGKLTLIAEPLFWLLNAIHAVVGNWGWAIIFLTMLIKLAFYRLSETSYRSMANMRRLTPELTRMKELYGDDRMKMNEAMMNLYKKEKVNPLGGCLPILVQIPVFIALYWVLVESVELRQAPFMLWIADMALPDPYYVLPIVMGVTMVIQQWLSPPPPDPMQAKIMMALPVLFTFMFLWFPAGLVLYWVVNNTLSIIQQYVITKRVEAGIADEPRKEAVILKQYAQKCKEMVTAWIAAQRKR